MQSVVLLKYLSRSYISKPYAWLELLARGTLIMTDTHTHTHSHTHKHKYLHARTHIHTHLEVHALLSLTQTRSHSSPFMCSWPHKLNERNEANEFNERPNKCQLKTSSSVKRETAACRRPSCISGHSDTHGREVKGHSSELDVRV